MCGLQVGFQAGAQVGQGVVGQAAHVSAAGFMAQHQCIGLRAVQQAQRYAGEGGMEQRALTFDQVPAVVVAGRRNPFHRTGNEVGHHRIHRHAGACNEDAGLAGGAEVGLDPAAAQFALHRQRGVHLAHRTVGAHSEQAAPGARLAIAHVQGRRVACVEQVAAIALRRGHDLRVRGQAFVQAGGHVHAGIQRGDHVAHGFLVHDAARVGHAHDHGVGTQHARLGEIQVRQSQGRGTTAAAELPHAPVRAPERQAARGLRRQVVAGVAQVQQVGRAPLGRDLVRVGKRHGGDTWREGDGISPR